MINVQFKKGKDLLIIDNHTKSGMLTIQNHEKTPCCIRIIDTNGIDVIFEGTLCIRIMYNQARIDMLFDDNGLGVVIVDSNSMATVDYITGIDGNTEYVLTITGDCLISKFLNNKCVYENNRPITIH